MAASNYKTWSKEELIARITVLENAAASGSKRRGHDGKFNFAAYKTQKIALKFCYSGWEYNGLAYQNKPTPLPTVEAVLFDALATAKLIDAEKGFEGCGWEKCGRTDRGVSAAGQVVSLYVRRAEKVEAEDGTAVEKSTRKDDLDYPNLVNRLLPPTIRVLAWSPVSHSFSARFNCTYRHYKYFFSSLYLNIPLMREAAAHLVGLHDFRNLCKIDAQKQITLFDRRILSAEIVPVAGDEGMYVFNLIGTAFLYHQVRCIMAILFLVGRDLEAPSIVPQLMNVTEGAESVQLEVIAQKPEYQMADALPLVLWDCAYADGDVAWQTGVDDQDTRSSPGRGVHAHLEEIHERSRIYTTLNKHFLAKSIQEKHVSRDVGSRGDRPLGIRWSKGRDGIEVLYGGGTGRKLQEYVPLMLRKRNDTVDMINERWKQGKGKRREMRTNGEGEDNDDDDGGGDE